MSCQVAHFVKVAANDIKHVALGEARGYQICETKVRHRIQKCSMRTLNVQIPQIRHQISAIKQYELLFLKDITIP